MRDGLVFLSAGIAYFVGSWIFLSLISVADDANQRFVIIFFLMPVAFMVFTVVIQRLLCFVTGTRISYFLHLALGAFTGLSCFLFSLDGLGQLLNADGVLQTLRLFSIPGVGAIAAGVVALGSHVVTRALHQSNLKAAPRHP